MAPGGGREPGKPKLLAGDNPQIPKGYGDEPVRAYIEAVPGWKQDVCRRIDEIVAGAVPGVCRAVKYNSPLYGVEEESWFLSYHCFTNFVKVTFFRGTSLDPVPPGESKTPDTLYYDVREDDLDEAQLEDWVRQTSRLPGETI